MKKFNLTISGNKYDVEIGNIEDSNIQVIVNGTIYDVEVDRKISQQPTQKISKSTAPVASQNVSQEKQPTSGGSGGILKSPLPATVIEIHVKTGESVNIGQKLITLEAMKMENVLLSEFGGKVISISCSTGDTIKEGDTIMVIGE